MKKNLEEKEQSEIMKRALKEYEKGLSLTQETEALNEPPTINPIEKHLCFLEISVEMLISYAEKGYTIDQVHVLKKKLARYFLTHYNYQNLTGELKLFDKFIFDIDYFKDIIHNNTDIVWEGTRWHMDVLEQLEAGFQNKMSNRKHFNYEFYPFIQLPDGNNIFHFFTKIEIYDKLSFVIESSEYLADPTTEHRLNEIKQKCESCECRDEIISNWKARILSDIKLIPNLENNEEKDGKIFDSKQAMLLADIMFSKIIPKNMRSDASFARIMSMISGYSISTLEDKAKEIKQDHAGYKSFERFQTKMIEIKEKLEDFLPKDRMQAIQKEYDIIKEIINDIDKIIGKDELKRQKK